MVKRLIAIAVGVSLGAVVCLVAGMALAKRSVHEDAPGCAPDQLIDCVRYDASPRPVPPIAVRAEIAAPCKGWLKGDASAALLSQCLHQARSQRDREFNRKLAIAASS